MSNSAPQPDERLRRPAGLRSLRLGETKVTYVPDGAVQLGTSWLPDATDEVWAAHSEYLDAAGYLVAGIGGLLVEHGGRALLIDAGFGPQSFPARPGQPIGAIDGGALLDNLAQLGRAPGQIEAVAFTHLHADHIGWARFPVPESDRPAFPQADYLVPEPDWSDRHLLRAPGTHKDLPARATVDGQEVFPGVRVWLTPGHTPGHAAYVITSGGQRLIAFGDALHSPIQIAHPDWSAHPDHDRVQSAVSRRRLVAALQEPDTIGFGIHFADVVFGRVRGGGAEAVWEPVDG